ncbi:MAG: FtsH protease activity modulator HflK [Rhodospirillaceae bacterium]|jgi:membrane protease subunit HflK|nr:FtsH protease activity modulator HflK [Rhodospirillaceae bacterium]|tara:strand:- start:1024 stop:2118 length:1095 start_codon:yes stop_codon:yes gene_type:complete
MPWKTPGGGGGGGQGPWGGGGPTGPTPPDIEEMLRRGQDRFKRFLPSGSGGARGLVLIVLVVAALWAGSGFYRVQPGEQGVELLFGKFIKLTSPGLNYWIPSPIGEVLKPNVERTNTITIGFRGLGEGRRGAGNRDVPQESLMLTGDQNIIDINFVVQWRIKNAANFLFNIRDPQATVKIAAESAMREIIGQTTLDDATTGKRQQVQQQSRTLLQQILDDYGTGVSIAEIQLQKSDPPAEVIDAFHDVQRARQDQERSINEAQAYKNDIVPKAKGKAQTMIQAAAAYKEKVTKEADGEAKRFLSVYETYKNAKDVTVRRLFLERMQEVLKGSEKVIIDKGQGGTGVVPYLPLPELRKRQGGASK